MARRMAVVGVCALGVALLAPGVGVGRARTVVVGCDDVVDHSLPAGYRPVLDAVAAPRAFLPNVGSDASAAPFSFWTKAGLVLRAGSTVTVRVAPRSAGRVRLTWGGATGSIIRFAACRDGAKWNGYAGGFLARTATACVPLIFAVGSRRAALTVGLGRHCST